MAAVSSAEPSPLAPKLCTLSASAGTGGSVVSLVGVGAGESPPPPLPVGAGVSPPPLPADAGGAGASPPPLPVDLGGVSGHKLSSDSELSLESLERFVGLLFG